MTEAGHMVLTAAGVQVVNPADGGLTPIAARKRGRKLAEYGLFVQFETPAREGEASMPAYYLHQIEKGYSKDNPQQKLEKLAESLGEGKFVIAEIKARLDQTVEQVTKVKVKRV